MDARKLKSGWCFPSDDYEAHPYLPPQPTVYDAVAEYPHFWDWYITWLWRDGANAPYERIGRRIHTALLRTLQNAWS